MAPMVPIATSNVSVTPGSVFLTRKNTCLSRNNVSRKSSKQTLPTPKCILPLSTSVKLFPHFRVGCIIQPKLRGLVVSATETDVAVEEVESTATDNGSGEASEASGESSILDVSPTSVQSRRSRPARKSEMPPVKNEDLTPGATFTGKVRSIQPFGAFVDFGAFTDGLVHVSRLSDSFVKDVGSIVSVGQEVTVRLVEANVETGRISLTMRESDDPSRPQQQNDSPSSSGDRSRTPRKNTQRNNQRRDDGKKVSKFVKGQDLEGTVKNLTRSGAFISLPEGEEGFLPASEEADEAFGIIDSGSSLQVGQEVSVRVLRITRGQVTLTMKKEEAASELDSKLNQGVVHSATNPFVLAFRSNEEISSFLDEREKEEELAEQSKEADVAANKMDVFPETTGKEEESVNAANDSVPETIDGEDTKQNIDEEVESAPENLAPEGSTSTIGQQAEVSPVGDAVETETATVSSEQAAYQISASETVAAEEVTEKLTDDAVAENEVETEIASVKEAAKETEETSGDDNDSISSPTGQSEAPLENSKDEESQEDAGGVETIVENTPSALEKSSDTAVQQEEVAPNTDQDINVANSSEQNGTASSNEAATKGISPALVKQLREETGAGMMDCKKALKETGGDIVKAQEYLRKKGLASADKKSSRVTAEGRIGSYIHDSRIGVLVEVNCETDFVSRGDIFKELVDDLAMQVAAYPQVQYLVPEDVPEEIVNKEREIEMQKEDLLSKPEQIRSKIVDGRINKRLEELALLEQPYIKNDKMVVKDLVKQTIATIGENIQVKRFVRYNLGEGLEKKSQDFAAEVAAQTAAKPVSSPVKEQPAVEAKETTVEAPRVAVSAALVKQLRDETGAGMMDCKKALSETGGDLEKAQEYLRKKGLSTADKKSSRLAAEGRIGSYIHDSRIGVLIEVNCETDFVARGDTFKELVDDIAMQVAACPQVQYVSIDEIPESTVNKEKELEMQREDLKNKPENIREKIVEGRVSKRLGELVLLEQPFIKDDGVLVKDLVKQTVAALGENIKVRRFVRFTLGDEAKKEGTIEEPAAL
ncbi:polyprotein of EF-Ts, chloroplastic [Lycium ferocissimum]|uniref:polyprotein of EF-Ts, chloroplastic n=1 Tax=Lycium ferocissimum TaxID=112874 RepID=UPI00281536CE|nr:polyprotein of EF-Ts, chloroplastic [Lycium ferocissimum]XP_059286488.1 polyprotein of EF-Ts, chloroplastic [Lycium ferocissimum]